MRLVRDPTTTTGPRMTTHTYIYSYGGIPFCGPGFCLKTNFCWGFKAKISQQNSHFLGQFLLKFHLCVSFTFSCFPSVSLCSRYLSPPLYKKTLGHRRASRRYGGIPFCGPGFCLKTNFCWATYIYIHIYIYRLFGN